MASTTMVHVRVDDKIKAPATKALRAMGLSLSDAVRVFLTRVAADQELPNITPIICRSRTMAMGCRAMPTDCPTSNMSRRTSAIRSSDI
jgi:addiction module RelB/DinJ family antitoxin